MRWQTLEGERFEVMHLYLGLPLIEQAARELLGPQSSAVALLDVSGARDETVHWLMESMRRELLDQRTPSQLCLRGLAQTLAVHLLRHYRDPQGAIRSSNALPAYKLRRVVEEMNAQLADDFSLTRLARSAELSEYHFSRMFKRATGLSPSQYFIGLRMARARQLLIETQRSVIDIGLEVGYSSPSHFSQVFRREVGVTPSAYRQA
jgi:AraC family transcriptional regulator